jgi:hypothetical protein
MKKKTSIDFRRDAAPRATPMKKKQIKKGKKFKVFGPAA